MDRVRRFEPVVSLGAIVIINGATKSFARFYPLTLSNDRGLKILAPLLETRKITKSFGNTHALRNVSVNVAAGEIVGLIGENGAGKSTLLHIVSGNIAQDSGTILVRGSPASFRNPRDANLHGVFHIYQELALLGPLPVFENFFLSYEDRFSRFGILDRGRMRDRAQEFLAAFDHEWINPSAQVDTYDYSTRQVIEIIKVFALSELLEVECPVVLLDEPTARLNRKEVEFFATFVRQVRDRAAIVLVSHRLTEVLELSDRVYVLKDGAITSEVKPSEASERELHRLMVGRERTELFYQEHLQMAPRAEPVLETRGLTRTGSFRDVNMMVNAGEIVGVAGVVGSGKSELAGAIFGGLSHTSGEILIDGAQIERHTLTAMARAGVGFVPPDRHAEGIMLELPVSWNISLAELAQDSGQNVLIDLEDEDETARNYISRLGIKTEGTRAPARTLSGGNQQKVLLARWLRRSLLKVLLLDNPTHGVDAGAKEDIYKALRASAEQGIGILLVSDDLLELIGLSNRILIMKDGAIVRDVMAPANAKPEEVELVAHML